MFDLTLIKDITEMLGKSLTFPDIEVIGGYLFKGYKSHQVDCISNNVTISPLKAANILVTYCEQKNKLKELFSFVIEMNNGPINGRIVKLVGLENILYRLSRTGLYFDFRKRKFISFHEDEKTMPNWCALQEGKEYSIIIASIDICGNSELVKKYKPSVTEKLYYKLWEFLKDKLYHYEGRIWSWAGDGGILAFREDDGIPNAVICCLEILISMPVFNALPDKPIQEDIKIRIGMDCGNIKFLNNTGLIVSDIINYAAHLEKQSTEANGLSISEGIYTSINPALQHMFRQKKTFEQKAAYSLTFNYENALGFEKISSDNMVHCDEEI